MKSVAITLFILTACLPATSLGQSHAVIRGQASAEPGHLVTLNIGESVGASYTWVFVAPPAHPMIISDGGRRMAFATRCSAENYVVVLLAVTVDATGQPSIDSTTHTVVVGEPGPGPSPEPPHPIPPAPEPEPDPDPVLPDSRFQLARLAYESAKQLPPASQANARTIAANFTAVASAAAAGAYQGSEREQIDAANRDIASRNRALLVGDTTWEPWFQTVGERMRILWNDRQMTTLDDHITAYREIALGLGEVK